MRKKKCKKENLDPIRSKNLDKGKVNSLRPYTKEEELRINEYWHRRKVAKPTKLVLDDNGEPKCGEKAEFWEISLLEATGSIDVEFSNELICQVRRTLYGGNTQTVKAINQSLVAMHGIKPRDTLEGLLAAQMIGAHNLAMECMKRAMIENQHPDAIKTYSSLANKFMRTFTSQMEALNRHRGNAQQKVTVEHVHVNEGGRAVVGNIN